MSWIKSGAIILLLAVPFALYGAWQVQAASRLDLIVSDPPPEKDAATKDKLAAASTANKAEAEKWDGQIQKVEAVAFQFLDRPGTDGVADDDCKALIKLLAARSADLRNLDRFLADADPNEFVKNALGEKLLKLRDSKKATDEAERAVTNWLGDSISAYDVDSADRVFSQFNERLDAYSKTAFADPAKAGVWKLQGRIKIMKALDDVANDPYQKVVRMPLPLNLDDSLVKKALDAPQALKKQYELFKSDLDKVKTDGKVDTEAVNKLAGNWSARTQYLTLFAEAPFDNPDGAAAWLDRVRKLYGSTNLEDDRARIRAKVQDFCEAFIPGNVLLDDDVLLAGNRIPRSKVGVKYYPSGDAERKYDPLTSTLDGLNEFNIPDKHPGDGTKVSFNDTDYFTKEIKPTDVSLAAKKYVDARRDVLNRKGQYKWSPNSIELLKNNCMEIDKDVNRIKIPAGKSEKGKPVVGRIWDRLQNLSEGAKMCEDLFQQK